MMNRRHFIQIGATSILALSANRFAMAKERAMLNYALWQQQMFIVS